MSFLPSSFFFLLQCAITANPTPNPPHMSSSSAIIEEFRDIVGTTPGCKYREKKAVGKGSFATV